MKQQEVMTFFTQVSKMAAPCALIASCSDFNPESLVRNILSVDELPDGTHVLESVTSYNWHIDNKYYTADVRLCTTCDRTIGDEKFAQSVEAFVVCFDSHDESSFQKVTAWLPYLEHINPSVQILVCKTCREQDAVGRQKALEWCIDNGFELVELEPEEISDDEEDDFKETTGVKRIVQALHAHTWPNLVMKGGDPGVSPFIRSLMQEEQERQQSESADENKIDELLASASLASTAAATAATDEVSGATVTEAACGTTEEKVEGAAGNWKGTAEEEGDDDDDYGDEVDKEAAACMSLEHLMPDEQEWAHLFSAVDNDGEPDDGEPFEQMFLRFQAMKTKAATLPPEERKLYAEQVAVAVWKAIGGDEDEIEGL